VAQQIDALQELSVLVSQSTKNFDASPAIQAPTFVPTPPPSPAPTPSPAPRAEAPRAQPAPTLPIDPPVAPARTAAPSRAAEADLSFKDTSDKGWVSNLIRGADTRETQAAAPKAAARQPRKPQHVVESLNSLSVDIARAIDHDASVELWQRYQRGERDIFTRRLYTIKGQKTFDDIQIKYAREPEFKKAVDRYMTDFEKLLSDVSRNDPSNVIGQSYLTSDTGKVYTMLAHASGRLK
jgi:hypothetical protein